MMIPRTGMKSARGFTLVETLVAIAILMIAVTGPYFSIQQAIMNSYAARDQLIASQLTQEGVEYVYFLRDSSYLGAADKSTAWTAWLSSMAKCTGAYGCIVDPSLNTLTQCTNAACTNVSGGNPALRLNSSNNLYTQSTSYPLTRFTRIVTLQKITNSSNPNQQEEQVKVTVTWTTEHHSYSVSSVEDLYNWL